MRKLRLSLSVACVIVGAGFGAPALAQEASLSQQDCEALAGFELLVDAIELETTGGVVDSATWMETDSHGTYCEVMGSINPVDPQAWPILWQANLPSKWNGKAIQYGGGGYNGTIPNTLRHVQLGLTTTATPLAQGYVTFGGDSGHPPESGGGAAFARNHEALVNYGYAHIGKTFDAMTTVAEQAYGEAADLVYFSGGSTGGREGLTAAMRWPDSYDGVITYYPSAHFMGLRLWGVALADAIYSDDSAGWFPPELVDTIAERAIELCDPLDGAEDGLVSNPAACRAVSSSIVDDLRCPEGQEDETCLNQTQIDRVIGVYHEGYSLPYELGGLSEYPGYNSLEGVVMNIGTQAEFINPPPSGPNAHHVNRAFQFTTNFVDTSEDFDLLEFDIQNPGEHQDRLVELAEIIGATETDLSDFSNSGGKIIWIHGADDPSITPWSSVALVDRIREDMGNEAVEQFLRFYVVPGLAHGGGRFSPEIDTLAALDNWVENGVPPAGMIMVDGTDSETRGRTRPVCEYPAFPMYSGDGDINEASSYHCATE
jgi:feruloyl esterase